MLVGRNGELAAAGLNLAGSSGDCATVAVIITTYNHARFLPDAINSVRAQTRSADEIIVVDDGSTDDPASVINQFPNVRLIRQDNCGPSAARNTGLRNCKASFVTFLDADDRLLPAALESGLACITARPECAFVYGGYRFISESGQPLGPDCFQPLEGDGHLALLRANRIIMHGTVLYRGKYLAAMNGFDETWRRSEDYDIYLRISQRYPIASYPETVAEYRRHGHNVSDAHFKMLKSVLGVLDRHETRITSDAVARAALQEGRTNRRQHYVYKALEAAHARWEERHDTDIFVKDYIQAARWSTFLTLRTLLGAIGHRASRIFPRPVVRCMEWIRGRSYP